MSWLIASSNGICVWEVAIVPTQIPERSWEKSCNGSKNRKKIAFIVGMELDSLYSTINQRINCLGHSHSNPLLITGLWFSAIFYQAGMQHPTCHIRLCLSKTFSKPFHKNRLG